MAHLLASIGPSTPSALQHWLIGLILFWLISWLTIEDPQFITY